MKSIIIDEIMEIRRIVMVIVVRVGQFMSIVWSYVCFRGIMMKRFLNNCRIHKMR